MKCPFCEGEFETISLRTAGGEPRRTKHCTQCGGFWFDRGITQPLSADSVAEHDHPQPNYSLQSVSLTCPNDQILLEQSEHDAGPNGLKMWTCPDCKGVFYPKGQLALYTNWLSEQGVSSFGLHARSQAALMAMMMVMGGVLVTAAVRGTGFQAATADPLPTAGPNVLTLVLLAVAYVAGTVLAVLGRRSPIIFMGWSVIAICLFGFFVIIFGP